ncbi:MAG: PAS domain S-box protein, partial [Bacteroidota bacterium]
PDFIGIYGNVAATNVPASFETYFEPQKNWYNISVYSPKKDYFAVIFDNISERKKAETELIKAKEKAEESEEKYKLSERDLIEAQHLAKIGIWHWNLETNNISWSDELITINGHNPNLPIPEFEDMSTFYTVESWKILNDAVQKTFNKGEPYELDLEMIRPDGSKIFTNTRGTAKYNTFGKLISLNGTVQDITEQKIIELELFNAKQKAEESEAMFKGIFNTVADAIFIYNPDNFEIIEANEATSKIYGYDRDELIGMSCLKFSAEVEKSKTTAAEVIQNGAAIVNLRHHKKKGGTDVFVQLEGHKIFVNDKAVVFTVCHDITNIKKAEDDLKLSEERLKLANIEAGIGTWDMDLITNELYWGEGNYKIHGIDPQNIKPSYEAFIRLIEPSERDYVNKAFADSINRKNFFDIDYTITRPDNGKKCVINSKANIILDNTGKAVRIIGIVHDITERKLAEQKLLFINTAVESASDAIGISDAQGHHFYQNKATTDLFEYTAEEMEAAGGGAVVVKDPEVAKEMFGNIMSGKAWSGELELVTKSGRVFTGYERANAVKDSDGKIIGLIGIISDITKLKQAEKELIKAKEKAEESDRLKSAFLANMSHEIRTPLNVIKGFSEMIGEEQNSAGELKTWTDLIISNSHLLGQLIDDIIDISLIDTGQLKIKHELFDVCPMLSQLYDEYAETKIKYRQTELEFKLDMPVKNIMLESDPVRLKQILTNLINNALKYTEKGSVEFGFKPVLKGLSEIVFYVRDTGIGIDEKHFGRIFERFGRIEDKDKLYRGTGLGLSIIKELAAILNGKVWCESKPGAGSTFYFSLPCRENDHTVMPVKIKEPARTVTVSEKIKVLIAEDEEGNYVLLDRKLKKYGFTTEWAKNGFEAVEFCEKNDDIKMVFMDLKMPGMDGFEATSRIKKIKPGLPVIAQTAFVMPESIHQATQCGCDDFLVKPIDMNLLNQLIEKYINK